MSKWINNEKFKDFVRKKKEEKSNEPKNNNTNTYYLKWQNPKMGTQDTPKVYKGRFLPDKNGDFYFKYLYHYFKSGDKTYFIKCEKTHGFDKFCPWCFVNQSLWNGNDSDKKKAYRYKRNERFVGNWFIRHDPRDADVSDDQKVCGTVRLYEFPPTIEQKIANELTNDEEGFGYAIFDPEEGHDLQIKVLAKKPDKNNQIWPDYSLTEFSRKKSAIADTKEEIEKIMESVYDLTEYINNMGLSWEAHETILKQEMVWEEVEDEFRKQVGKLKSDENVKEENTEEENTDIDNKEESDLPFEPDTDENETNKNVEESDSGDETDDDSDDEELLEELRNL
ncbi:MAG: hypothetical protein ACOCP4_01950 [Candidatus Woesearchaeota archaeon]